MGGSILEFCNFKINECINLTKKNGEFYTPGELKKRFVRCDATGNFFKPSNIVIAKNDLLRSQLNLVVNY